MTSPEQMDTEYPDFDPVATIARHLRDGGDVIRCAAARAIGSLGDEAAASDLVAALLDQDPDVRTDAMAALVSCARPQDNEAIRRSLTGDPVKEVKVLALQALCRLKDAGSSPLIRALAKDRCDDDVAWEDGAGMWDDWLDVQVAAITALGNMGVSEAVDDLLEARTDEMAQDLDSVVFDALAQIPEGGVESLLGLLRNGEARVRERVLVALSKADRNHLAPMIDVLVRDASPDVRRLAIAGLDHDNAQVPDLALRDPDVTVRRAAIAAFSSARSDIAEAALADADEEVRVLALETVMAHPERPEDLAANVQAWLDTGGTRLAAACAAIIPKLIGALAEDALCKVAADDDHPQEVRIAALRSLGAFDSEKTIATLQQAVIDPARQVRATALAALVELVKAGAEAHGPIARDILIDAIRGGITVTSGSNPPTTQEQSSLLDASKVEEGQTGQIRISSEGEIVPVENLTDNVTEGQFPTSTLEAIGALAPVPSLTTDAPDRSDQMPHSRRSRVAVDGPDDIAPDIQELALRIAADCPGVEIEQALAEVLDTKNSSLRAVAVEAIAKRSEKTALSAEMNAKLADALGDPDPLIRGHVARAVMASDLDVESCFAALFNDSDAIVRSIALEAVATSAPDKAIPVFRDSSARVRRSALEIVLNHGNMAQLEEALGICLELDWTDTLTEACTRSVDAHNFLLSFLAGQDISRRQTQSALVAIAAGSPSDPRVEPTKL